jgi:putative flippase GtrA
MQTNALSTKIIRYLGVGSLGFCIDALVLTVLTKLGLSSGSARIVSLLCSITITWLLNRRFGFRVITQKSPSEYLRYALVSLLSAIINYAVYLSCLAILIPLGALCVGTACAMVFNFCGYNFWVFSNQQNKTPIVS